MAGMIKSGAKRIYFATASAVFLGIIGYFGWREYVTFRPDTMDKDSSCDLHGTPLKWARVVVTGPDTIVLVTPADDYLDAQEHFPLHKQARKWRVSLPQDRDPNRWWYAYSRYCTECDNAYANWSRMSPEDKDRFAQQPVRYVRTPEFVLRIGGEKGHFSCQIGEVSCSLEMLDDLFHYFRDRHSGDNRLILELGPGLAPEDAAPVVNIAEQQGLTNIAFRVGGKPSPP